MHLYWIKIEVRYNVSIFKKRRTQKYINLVFCFRSNFIYVFQNNFTDIQNIQRRMLRILYTHK